MSAIISAEIETANSATPSTSIETTRGRFFLVQKNRNPSAAKRPTGTLIQKIQAHGRL